MSRVKWLIVALLSVVLLYSAAWLAITFSLSQHLNKEFAGKANRIFGFEDDDYKISFFKAVPDGFPFKLGLKIHNLSEESKTSLISHQAPVRIGYDLPGQKFYLIYNGESLSCPKPLESGFGTKIIGEFAHYISYSLSPKLFKIFNSPERGFELINFVNSFEFTSKDVKAYDILDKSLLFDESYLSAKLAIEGRPYYHNIEDLRASPPGIWRLTSKSKINNVIEGRRIAVASIVYGIIPSSAFNHDVDIDLIAHAKNLDLTEFVRNAELKSRRLNFSDATEDSSSEVRFKSVADDNDIEITLHFLTSSMVKPNFLEKKIDNFKKLASDLINMEEVVILKPALNAFLENPQKFLPKKNDLSKIEAAVDFKLLGKENKLNLELENFSIQIDDSAGFKLQNNSEVDNLFAWKSSGILSLSKYKNSVDFISDYVAQIREANHNLQLNDLNKETYNSFLRLISNHPESDSEDLVLNYEFSSDLAGGKIGANTMPDVINLYYTTLYRKAIETAKKAPDFTKALEELAPDLLTKPELLEKLQNEV